MLQFATKQTLQRDDQEHAREQEGKVVTTMVPLETERGTEEIPYTTSKVFSVSVEVDSLELQSIISSYQTDKYFQKV